MANLPSVSAIPGALASALTIATETLPSGSTVYYGAELPAYSAPLTFQISEITGDQKWAELGPQYRREEEFNLVCSLIAYTGGVPDFVAELQSLMDNFALLARAIANNPTLNGAVRLSEVGNFQISPETDTRGESATTLDFAIRCQQRVRTLT